MSIPTETALEVLQIERAGIDALIAAFADTKHDLKRQFDGSIETILNATGRTVITGMGKSGHIARKIAATFASTGTPAVYVHPGEASHGDLGMISEDDLVIALSNSGETPELGDIIGYCGRFDIPLIGMTSGPESTLAKAANFPLIVPKSKEACGITKAPTTSTTQMLVLGDALAVALLREKGFSAQDFHTFHPGGKLGAALKRVTDLMHHKKMPLCSPDAPFSVVVQEITDGGFGCCGVLDDGQLIGIVTDGDVRRALSESKNALSASKIMTKNPHTISESGLAAEALSMLSEFKITALFIVNETNEPIGLIHVHDCLAIGVV